MSTAAAKPGIEVISIAEQGTELVDRWIARRLDSGHRLALIDEPAPFLATHDVVAVTSFNPLLWGPAESVAIEAFLLDAVAPNGGSAAGQLVAAIAALRTPPSNLRSLPALVRQSAVMTQMDRSNGAPPGGVRRQLAAQLQRLLNERSGPWLGAAVPVTGRHYTLTTAGLNAAGARLRIAFFLLCWRACMRDARAAVVLRMPATAKHIPDGPLLHLLERLPMDVLVTIADHAAIGLPTQSWLSGRLQHSVFSPPPPDIELPPVRIPPSAGAAPTVPIARNRERETSDYDAATSRARLHEAWNQVRDNSKSAGVDGMTPERFHADLYPQMFYLEHEVRERSYVPMPLLRAYVIKASGEPRPLGIPTVRDRLVQYAVVRHLTARTEEVFLGCSFAYRPQRNGHQALGIIEQMRADGFTWVVNADIRKCFDSLDHELLFSLLTRYVSDPDLLHLIQQWVTVPVQEDGEALAALGRGVPQGSPISPLLANIYLHPLDVYMRQQGYRWVRYADDFLCLLRSETEARQALGDLERFVETRLRLSLKPDRTDVTSFAAGVDFLGFTLRERTRYITPGRIEDARSRLLRTAANGTRSIGLRLTRINQQISGFGAYFLIKQPLVMNQLREFDGWCRSALGHTLQLPPEELGKIRSVFYRSRQRGSRHDYYPDLLDLANEGDAEPLQKMIAPVEDSVSVPTAPAASHAPSGSEQRVVESGEAPPRPLEEQATPTTPAVDTPPTLLLAPQSDEANSTTVAASAPVLSAVVATEAGAAAEPGPTTETLFLSEGYAKEDLREFLRLATTDDRPVLNADGTLHVTVHGCTIGKTSQQVVVRKRGETIFVAGLVSIRALVVQAVGATVNSTLLRALAERSIPVHFLNWKGEPYGHFSSPPRRTPAIVRGQFRAFDEPLGVAIAVEMLGAKIKNQAQVLRLYERYREKRNPALATALRKTINSMQRHIVEIEHCEGPAIDAVRGRLLGAEGRAAAAYFRGIAALIGPERGFTSRTRGRTATDALNSLLDYTYRLLYTRCHRALLQEGIDARAGLVHTDGERAKLSMLYDFVEEFRAVGADRPMIALLTRGGHARKRLDGSLTLPTRRKLVAAFDRNLSHRCRYRGERISLGEIIDRQARHLAEVFASSGRVHYRGFLYNH